MPRGNQKGGAFERRICVALSQWVSRGKRKDLFWRSAMSGGRATVAAKRGELLHRQSGDMCAISPEGFVLTDTYFFEFKHYRDIGFTAFVLEGRGLIAKWWKKARKEALRHNRVPVLIVKGNKTPILVITTTSSHFSKYPVAYAQGCSINLFNRIVRRNFDDSEKKSETNRASRRARITVPTQPRRETDGAHGT